MTDRVAIVSGVRTPFCRSKTVLQDVKAEDLGAYAIKELLAKTELCSDMVQEVVFGNVLQPPESTNIARAISLKAGLPITTPALTVNRNCASGMDAVICAAQRILLGDADTIVAGGTESMSHFPLMFGDAMRRFVIRLSLAKRLQERVKALLSFRLSFLKPQIPGIVDPICALSMGQTAELLAREFHITRKEQDQFALKSHKRALKAIDEGFFKDEIIPVPLPPTYDTVQLEDLGPRREQTLEVLAGLRPAFDSISGTVSAGNASQVTDGAVALLLMSEDKVKALGIRPLGFIKAYATAALEPKRMGLGPVFATSKVLEKANYRLSDCELIEINEAFAAQIMACEKAFASQHFAEEELGRKDPVGQIDPDLLNVNGGAIALGHPLGASGARLILTLLRELRRRDLHIGLAALCVGGGQGEAVIVEAAR